MMVRLPFPFSLFGLPILCTHWSSISLASSIPRTVPCSCLFFQPVAPLHYFFLLKQVIINVPPFCTQPCPQTSSVNCSIMKKNWKFCWTMGLISHISQNSSKFGCSSWLWWIMRGILANQKGRNSYFWKEVTWTFPQDSTRAHNWLTRLSNMASGCGFFLLNFYSFQRINGALLIFLGVNRENVFAICLFVA